MAHLYANPEPQYRKTSCALYMCYRMSDLAGDNFTNGVRDGISDMVRVCYSSSSTCIAFVAALLRLLFFAVLCHLLLWWHKTTPGWLYHPKGCGLIKGGGFIPRKGWLYPPKGVVLPPKRVVLSPEKVGITPPRVVYPPIGGGFMPRTTPPNRMPRSRSACSACCWSIQADFRHGGRRGNGRSWK